MSTETVGRWTAHARRDIAPSGPALPVGSGERSSAQLDEAIDFVRFCYRRRRVGWPDLYDEMCAVAARGSFRGLGYTELAERGIHFSLDQLPGLAALTQRVIGEERASPEPGRADGPVPMMLVAQPANG